MNFFEQFVHFLQFEAPKPTPFGWFHLMFIGIFIALSIFLAIRFRNATNKQNKIILLVTWIILFLFEAYKQLVYSFSFENGVATWDYQWYAFPFQFCSSPIFILPFAIFIKNEKIQDYFTSFLSFFAIFGGLITFILPEAPFNTHLLGVQIQTMVHHGLMIAIGVYLIVRNRHKLNIKYYLKGLLVFVILLAIAMIMNETMIFAAAGEEFNMFYISRHFANTMPVLSIVYASTPYIVFLLSYIFGFALIGLIFFGISKLIVFLTGLAKSKNKKSV